MIRLDVHICDQRRSYAVTFTGPQAEDHALAFMASRRSTHNIGEDILTERVWICDSHGGDSGHYEYRPLPAEDQPHLISSAQYPRLYAALYPTCEHGMDAHNCYGPAHYVRDDELAMGW